MTTTSAVAPAGGVNCPMDTSERALLGLSFERQRQAFASVDFWISQMTTKTSVSPPCTTTSTDLEHDYLHTIQSSADATQDDDDDDVDLRTENDLHSDDDDDDDDDDDESDDENDTRVVMALGDNLVADQFGNFASTRRALPAVPSVTGTTTTTGYLGHHHHQDMDFPGLELLSDDDDDDSCSEDALSVDAAIAAELCSDAAVGDEAIQLQTALLASAADSVRQRSLVGAPPAETSTTTQPLEDATPQQDEQHDTEDLTHIAWADVQISDDDHEDDEEDVCEIATPRVQAALSQQVNQVTSLPRTAAEAVCFAYPWTAWYDPPRGKGVRTGISKDMYEQNLFMMVHALIDWDHLPVNSMVSFSREGIKPFWEDPHHCHGGRWIVRSFPQDASEILFTKAVLSLFLQHLPESETITCISLQIKDKRRGNAIQLWTNTLDTACADELMEHVAYLMDDSETSGGGPTTSSRRRRRGKRPQRKLHFEFCPNSESIERNAVKLDQTTDPSGSDRASRRSRKQARRDPATKTPLASRCRTVADMYNEGHKKKGKRGKHPKQAKLDWADSLLSSMARRTLTANDDTTAITENSCESPVLQFTCEPQISKKDIQKNPMEGGDLPKTPRLSCFEKPLSKKKSFCLQGEELEETSVDTTPVPLDTGRLDTKATCNHFSPIKKDVACSKSSKTTLNDVVDPPSKQRPQQRKQHTSSKALRAADPSDVDDWRQRPKLASGEDHHVKGLSRGGGTCDGRKKRQPLPVTPSRFIGFSDIEKVNDADDLVFVEYDPHLVGLETWDAKTSAEDTDQPAIEGYYDSRGCWYPYAPSPSLTLKSSGTCTSITTTAAPPSMEYAYEPISSSQLSSMDGTEHHLLSPVSTSVPIVMSQPPSCSLKMTDEDPHHHQSTSEPTTTTTTTRYGDIVQTTTFPEHASIASYPYYWNQDAIEHIYVTMPHQATMFGDDTWDDAPFDPSAAPSPPPRYYSADFGLGVLAKRPRENSESGSMFDPQQQPLVLSCCLPQPASPFFISEHSSEISRLADTVAANHA